MPCDQSIDLSHVLNQSHDNKWVALAPDYSRVIGSADTLRDLFQTMTDAGAVFHRVRPTLL